MVNNKLKSSLLQLREALLLMLPKNRSEVFILLIFLAIYLPYSIFLAINSSVIDSQTVPCDIYFQFDNTSIFHTGKMTFSKHPLLILFTKPVICAGDFFAWLGGNPKLKAIFWVFVCSLLVSLSGVFVYRYMKEIIKLKKYPLLLLTFFYAFFSTNLILCFTTESFTVTLFLLSFVVYYYSHCIETNKTVGLLTGSVLAISLGGITLTNFVKGIIPFFFMKQDKKVLIKALIAIGLLLLISILLWQYNERISQFVSNIQREMRVYGMKGNKPFFWIAINDFLASPVLFYDFLIEYKADMVLPGGPPISYHELSINSYPPDWKCIFAFSLLFIFLISALRNYKHRLFLLLASLFAVDIFIHLVCGYGLREPFIYGGHWVYCVPLFMGWLLASLKDKPAKITLGFFSLLFVAMVINNICHLYEFIEFALLYHPA
ncbi:DUF6080 domain-containing protein [Viscerimonas tarda]